MNDVEFRQYIPFLYEISYKFMFRLYTRHRDQTPGEGGQPQRCPEVDIMEYVPSSEAVDNEVKKCFVKVFINELFKTKSVMKRGALIKKVTEQVYNWLQPHHIRIKAYEKYRQMPAE